MIQKHFIKINSTQEILLDFPREDKDFLISTNKQLAGKGQYDRKWNDFPDGLAFSCTLKANPINSLTSLEVGVMLHRFFSKYYKIELGLKWPNDLFNDKGKKVGGVLTQSFVDQRYAVGIGLNYKLPKNYDGNAGTIFHDLKTYSFEKESARIYDYMLKHRIDSETVITEWQRACIHMNKEVTVKEDEKEYKGIFAGLGKDGEALIQIGEELKQVYSASIII